MKHPDHLPDLSRDFLDGHSVFSTSKVQGSGSTAQISHSSIGICHRNNWVSCFHLPSRSVRPPNLGSNIEGAIEFRHGPYSDSDDRSENAVLRLYGSSPPVTGSGCDRASLFGAR